MLYGEVVLVLRLALIHLKKRFALSARTTRFGCPIIKAPIEIKFNSYIQGVPEKTQNATIALNLKPFKTKYACNIYCFTKKS